MIHLFSPSHLSIWINSLISYVTFLFVFIGNPDFFFYKWHPESTRAFSFICSVAEWNLKWHSIQAGIKSSQWYIQYQWPSYRNLGKLSYYSFLFYKTNHNFVTNYFFTLWEFTGSSSQMLCFNWDFFFFGVYWINAQMMYLW